MKKLYVMGGGTISHVRNHLALCAPAFGTTARQIADLCLYKFKDMKVYMIPTKMASPSSDMITNDDVKARIEELKKDMDTKIIFFDVALCDWTAVVGANVDNNEVSIPSGKYAERLKTSEGSKMLWLSPAEKIIKTIREGRKDIFVVGFKTTCGATERDQYEAGRNLLKTSGINVVLANDTRTRINMIVIPDTKHYRTKHRNDALRELVEITYKLQQNLKL